MMMRPAIYCILDFFQNISSLMSLCMSSYGLAYSIGQPWMWNNILIVSCISTTIVSSAFRQSMDKLFMEEYILKDGPTSPSRHEGQKDKESSLITGQNPLNTATTLDNPVPRFERTVDLRHVPTYATLPQARNGDHSPAPLRSGRRPLDYNDVTPRALFETSPSDHHDVTPYRDVHGEEYPKRYSSSSSNVYPRMAERPGYRHGGYH